MTADARNLWYWITTCVDDPTTWCPPGRNTGPEYDVRTTNAVWKEVQDAHDRQTVFVDQQYYYRLLDGQRKGDGRGAQANAQLFRHSDRVMVMNLHIPLYREEVNIIPADDGGGDWIEPVRNNFKGKKKKGPP